MGCTIILSLGPDKTIIFATCKSHRKHYLCDVPVAQLYSLPSYSWRTYNIHVAYHSITAVMNVRELTATKNSMHLQVNYHGPYTLTRLLEPVLIASKPCRIVNVASVEHRIGYIRDLKKFMFDAKQFLYSGTKLGNVLFTYEHQRRLGALGVQVGMKFVPNTALHSNELTLSCPICLLPCTNTPGGPPQISAQPLPFNPFLSLLQPLISRLHLRRSPDELLQS